MKAWLKGGLIAGTLDLLVIIFAILTSSPNEADLLAVAFFQMPFSYLVNRSNLFMLIVSGLIGWFLIGTLISWLVGKIKSNAKKK